MRKIILGAIALACLAPLGQAQAARPEAGDIAVFYTDLASRDATASASPTALVSQPTYNVGFFVNELLMPYGGIQVVNRNDSDSLLRGGARFYGVPGDTGDLSTFVAGEASVLVADNDAFGLGGYFGVEYHIARQFSISGRIGLRRIDPDQGESTWSAGTSDLSVNFYF